MSELAPIPILEIKQLDYRYADGKRSVLSIDNWVINQGQHVFLHGASGSGKTTLLNLISGVSPLKQGQINILGQSLNKMSTRQRDAFRADHIGVVFQQLNLIPYLSVLDNILLAAEFNHSNRASRPQLIAKAESLLTELKMPLSLLQTKASQLSVGQQQRVAIVRAMINSPELLIADEPTSALDSDSRDAFIRVLFQMAQSNQITLLFVSHDKQLAEHFELVQSLADINKVTD